MITLDGKIILITGGSSGIGRACALMAAQLGAGVVLIARNEEKLKQTFDTLPGKNHSFYSCDVTDSERLEEIIAQVSVDQGKISGFIHSAGIEITMPLRNMNRKKFEDIFSINVISGLEIARLLSSKKYLAPEGTSFIFIGSVLAIRGKQGVVAYSSTKSALVGGVKSMAIELAPKNIRVNCIMPGVVETEMITKLFQTIREEARMQIISTHPLGLGKPEDVAHLCSFLLSDAARWITGSVIPIDGGYSAN